MSYRKIIHIDMDAFYASVEQRNNPELKGRPVIVGGPPDSRGVVSACSYEARKFGVHSAMASSIAYRKCPEAVFVRPDFSQYIEVSNQIREIFHFYTDLVEPLSLDEAYLDVTENYTREPYATTIAKEIKTKIFEQTELTASAGISYNKFLAKVASDFNKPDGLTVVTPEMAQEFIDGLPIGKFFGIGKVTEKKMISMGIKYGRDLRDIPLVDLVQSFGKMGAYYYSISHGIDDRPVMPERIRKSVGKEVTLSEDITDLDQMKDILSNVARELSSVMTGKDIKGRTITLKVKYHDFSQVTRSISLNEYINEDGIITLHVNDLLSRTEAGIKEVRLLGISISNLDNVIEEQGSGQLILPFEEL